VIIIVNTLDEAVKTDIEMSVGRLRLLRDREYKVTYRMGGEKAQISGSKLTQLSNSLGGKAGDIIQIQPA
jgi:hypothetical protein